MITLHLVLITNNQYCGDELIHKYTQEIINMIFTNVNSAHVQYKYNSYATQEARFE